MEHSVVFSIFLIFAGASLLATAFLYFRQPLLIAYITLGIALGPYGLEWISDTAMVNDVSHIGIVFLLFLIGLDMQPAHLLSILRRGSSVAIVSSALFGLCGYGVAMAFGFGNTDSLIVGATTMFSSTIIGIKLLPTTVLHHKQTGELVVGLLLLQDMIAIVLLTLISNATVFGFTNQVATTTSAFPAYMGFVLLPLFAGVCWGLVHWVILPLISRNDRFHEYIFLLAIGWCLACAETASMLELSAEVGAFIGGISLASSPISQYIAISLKPIRDFFLVLFFFSVGASFNIYLVPHIWLPALCLSTLVIVLKPLVFQRLVAPLCNVPETRWEVGFRLGQTSEFSILVATLALSTHLINETTSILIQATAILTFAISSYIVVWCFKSPIAVKDHLRHD